MQSTVMQTLDGLRPTRRSALRAGAGALCTLVSRGVWAQALPSRLVVGFAAGGTADVAARAVASSMPRVATGEVLVENRAGAGGRIALQHMRLSADDGSVAIVTPDASMFLFPHVYPRLGFDPERDFQPIARVANLAIALYVGSMVPSSVATVADFVAWVRGDARRLSFGTPAAGATPHFVGEMFARSAGLPMTAVHYRGGAAAIQDLIGGHLPAYFGAVPDGAVMQSAGRVRALGTSGPSRSTATPDVPTFAEQGHAALVVEDGLGIHVPAGVPRWAVQAFADVVEMAIGSPGLRRAYASIGLDRAFEGPSPYAARLRNERLRWAGIVRNSGFKAQDED